MLFRPFVLSHANFEAVPSNQRAEAAQKTRTAAMEMNGFLERILDLDLVEYLSPSV